MRRDRKSQNNYSWALKQTFLKLNPRMQWKNPVMFLVYIGAIYTTGESFYSFSWFSLQINLWLWFTVLFANFAEAIAEGRGKAQAESLKSAKKDTIAHRLNGNKETDLIATQLKKGDIVICRAGDLIPADGDVIEGIASIDESAITGESAPVIREDGGDRSGVMAGTRVISDWVKIKVSVEQGESYIDKMIELVEGAKRGATPNEVALSILLIALTIIFVVAVVSLKGFILYSERASGAEVAMDRITVLIALLVCLIPTTIGGLLSAIGISGMERLLKRNILAKSGKAVEAAGDIDVLLLDKTGTITLGNRLAYELITMRDVSALELAQAAFYSSEEDRTPEGKSIISLIQSRYHNELKLQNIKKIAHTPFSAETRMSGIDLENEHGEFFQLRKGALDAVKKWVVGQGGKWTADVDAEAKRVAMEGGTPLVVASQRGALGVVYLKDIVKPGMKERLLELRKMGIKTVMVTGDNPLTAGTIAAEAGVEDFIAEATPVQKLEKIRAEQKAGKMVAMVGDGTNDAPALAQADIGLAMNSGTQAAKEAANMVDLDSDPAKLIDVVETGKELLITRGALTTFSITNDVAKYFAILPALFGSLYAKQGNNGPLSALNILHLSSPESAILSAVIFNALIIIVLIPLALRGVKVRAMKAETLVKINILIYGVGGIIVPFIGIKLIDMLVSMLGFGGEL